MGGQNFNQKAYIEVPILGKQRFSAGALSAGGGGISALNELSGAPSAGTQRTRINLDLLVIDVTAANDYGSAELIALPNRDFKIVGAKIHGGDGTPTGGGVVLVGFTSSAGNVLDVSIGTAAASSATLNSTMADVLQKLDGTSVQPGVGNVHGFADKTTSGLVIVAGASNKLYINISDPVASGTASAAFVGCWVEIDYIDLGPK